MLHILSQSPIEPAILERVATGDTIILIEDAVIEALATSPQSQHWQNISQTQRVCVLSADIEVRGLATELIPSTIEAVDYRGFVQLTLDNEVIHSWH